jgi:hypothetical protein
MTTLRPFRGFEIWRIVPQAKPLFKGDELSISPTALDYPEPPSPSWCRLGWLGGRRRKCRIDRFADRPHMICDPERYGWRGLM